MEEINKDVAKRVWQRVQAGQSQQPPIPALLLGELESAAAYRQLEKQAAPHIRPLARQLSRLSGECAAALKGLCVLEGVPVPAVSGSKPRQEPVRALLRRQYGSALGRLEQYRKLLGDGQYGSVFESLAEKKQQELWLLARTIGG